MDWIELAQDWDHWWALAHTMMNLQVCINIGKFLSSCTTGGFSRRAHLHEVSYVVCSRFQGLGFIKATSNNSKDGRDTVYRPVLLQRVVFLCLFSVID
jgi:hypothetical protein